MNLTMIRTGLQTTTVSVVRNASRTLSLSGPRVRAAKAHRAEALFLHLLKAGLDPPSSSGRDYGSVLPLRLYLSMGVCGDLTGWSARQG